MSKKKHRDNKIRQPEKKQENPPVKTRPEKADGLSFQARVKKNPLVTGFAAALGLLLILDFFVHKHEPVTVGNLPEFYAVYGFLSAAVLVFSARGLIVLFGSGRQKK